MAGQARDVRVTAGCESPLIIWLVPALFYLAYRRSLLVGRRLNSADRRSVPTVVNWSGRRVLDKSGICFLTRGPRDGEVIRCRSRTEFTG